MRHHILSLSFAAVMALHSPAFAQSAAEASVADGVIARIQSEGYTVTEVRRSWLGRIVITADNPQGQREIVLNRTSGEVLRDQRFPAARSGSREAPARAPQPSGRPGREGQPGPRGDGAGPSGSGGGGRG